jgi:hypothetical protein
MAALLKSAESKDFVGSNPTLSAITTGGAGDRSADETDGGDWTGARPVRHVSPFAADPDGSRLQVSAVRALRDGPAIPAIPEPPGPALRRLPARAGGARVERPPLTPDAQPAILPATSRRAGNERDEYPSSVGRETRWLVETGATTAGNGPGSLRTERNAAAAADPVGSGAERQRYRAAPIATGPTRRRRSRECGIAE